MLRGPVHVVEHCVSDVNMYVLEMELYECGVHDVNDMCDVDGFD